MFLYLRQELYGIGGAVAFDHHEGKVVDWVDTVAYRFYMTYIV